MADSRFHKNLCLRNFMTLTYQSVFTKLQQKHYNKKSNNLKNQNLIMRNDYSLFANIFQ